MIVLYCLRSIRDQGSHTSMLEPPPKQQGAQLGFFRQSVRSFLPHVNNVLGKIHLGEQGYCHLKAFIDDVNTETMYISFLILIIRKRGDYIR